MSEETQNVAIEEYQAPVFSRAKMEDGDGTELMQNFYTALVGDSTDEEVKAQAKKMAITLSLPINEQIKKMTKAMKEMEDRSYERELSRSIDHKDYEQMKKVIPSLTKEAYAEMRSYQAWSEKQMAKSSVEKPESSTVNDEVLTPVMQEAMERYGMDIDKMFPKEEDKKKFIKRFHANMELVKAGKQ